ncbi:MAG: class I tRNA ligase family protein, partial [Phycisphaerales bacterium]|nr:class I tRNA ligase family protein [Phycisphaerales bacterium]
MPGPELPKAYRPSDHEGRIRARWDQARAFHADPQRVGKAGKQPYAIVIPPPNVTAALHLGHALNNTLQDVQARAHRMMGFETLWMPGTDHAGIATQTVVEKRLLKDEGKRRTDYPRDEFVAKVQAFKDEYEAVITGQLKAMGCSCDWDRQRFTMDDICARAVREAFFRLFQDGLIYRGKRLVNWDPVTQTVLADDEVEMEEVDGHFYYLRYPLCDASGKPIRVRLLDLASGAEKELDHVAVATTRPETYLGDTAVAVNPRDPRWAALKAAGAHVRLPFVNRIIPVLADDYVVMPASLQADPEEAKRDAKAAMATGFLKVTPAHDPNDEQIGKRHNLPAINVMAPDASISDKFGWTDVGDASRFIGMPREKAREAVVAAFREKNLLEAIKPHRHSVGHSYRSHAPIEPYLSDQWYIAVKKQIPSLPDKGLIAGTDVPVHSLAGLALTALAPSSSPPTPPSGAGVPPASTPPISSKGSSIPPPPPSIPSNPPTGPG